MATRLNGLTFVIPVYNEQEAIVSTVTDLSKTLEDLNIPYEIIVIDDGSVDETAPRLQEIEIKNFVLLKNPTNSGYGAAIKKGLLEATYEWVGIIDGDGSYEIEAIPRLVAEAEKGFDMVVGNRKNISRTDSPIKRFFRSVLRTIVWLLVDKQIKDINSGFRLVRKSAVTEFFPFLCSTFSFTTSLSIFFAERGLFVADISTEYRDREGNSKVRHIRDSLRAFHMILQGVTYFNPIKTFVFIAALMIIVVCVPAMCLAMLHMATLSAYYMIFGSVVTLLLGLGILGDIVRTSAMRADLRYSAWSKTNQAAKDSDDT